MPSSQSPIPFNDHHRQDADLSGEVDGGVHQAALRLTTLSCDGPYNDDTARDHELLNEGEDSKALFQAISRASDASRITVNRKSRRSYEQPKRVRNDILKLDTGGKQTAVGKPAVKQSRKRSQKGRVRFSAFTKDHDGLDEVCQLTRLCNVAICGFSNTSFGHNVNVFRCRGRTIHWFGGFVQKWILRIQGIFVNMWNGTFMCCLEFGD